MEDKVQGFEVYEKIGICIPNPRTVAKFTGPPEMLERLIAFWLQSGMEKEGMEIEGLTEEERQRYLAMDIET